MILKKIIPCIAVILFLHLSCYFNPAYDVSGNGQVHNVTCIIQNGGDTDIFRVFVCGIGIDTVCFHQKATVKTLHLSVPQGSERYIRIDGYVAGRLTYTKDFFTHIPAIDTVLTVELSIIKDPVPPIPCDVALALLPANVVKITWHASDYAQGYSIFRSEIAGAEGACIASCNATLYLDSSVSAERTYYYGIKAYNSSGTSGISEQQPITIPQLNELPAKPDGLVALDTGATSVTLTWNRVLAASSYRLYRITGNGTPADCIATVGDLSYIDQGLKPLTVYSYAVSAVNSIGESTKSDKITLSTTAPVPEAPQNVSAKALSDVSIQVLWDSVAYALEYEVYGSSAQDGVYAKTGVTNSYSWTVAGLTPETVYFYKVKSVNSAGVSAFSGIASAKTLPAQIQKPQTPKGLQAKPLTPAVIAVSFNRADKASWYTIYRSASSSGAFSKIKTFADTTACDSGLSENTRYYYKVSAGNSAGESALSDTVSAKTFMFIPAPTGLSAQAQSPSRITVSWNSVAGVICYRVFRSLNSGGTPLEIASVTAPSHTDTGLQSNTTYYYKVSAVGGNGESALSVEASATTHVPPPETPGGLKAQALSAVSIRITFNSAAGASGYILYWSKTLSGVYDSLAATGSTTYDHTGLTPNTDYFYKVCAYNDFGRSPLSAAVSAKTEPGALPDAPTGVQASALSSSQIKIQYNPVSGVTGYKLYYSLSLTGAFTLATTTASTSYTHTGLDAGTEYFYKVTAYNANGESAFSTVASAKTLKRVAYINASSCNGCGRCVSNFHCPEGAIYSTGGKYAIDPDKCSGCGDCTTKFSCPRGAISMKDAVKRAFSELWKIVAPEKEAEIPDVKKR